MEYLTRQEIVRYITHADALVMVRARDLKSEASYPSKLTEYLATGKPVVSVNVGEISDFITDSVHAFLIEPGNALQLADKLDFIFNNPGIAKKVGENGKNLTGNIFNYKYQASRMVPFINSLYQDKIA
jgi:glycosyltransferase involved in cell wall biosynthesis